jgi:hypothetical protein
MSLRERMLVAGAPLKRRVKTTRAGQLPNQETTWSTNTLAMRLFCFLLS